MSGAEYPTTPAYGAHGADGVDRADGADGALRADAAPPSGRWLALGLALGWNALTLVGVLMLGWPVGNVFLLFWVENAVLGLCTLVKVATAQGPPGTLTVNGRPRAGSPALWTVFFALHYGIFCTVHLVFTGLVAGWTGLAPTFWLLGLPAVLLVVRYTVETARTWFGPDGQRLGTSPRRAMVQPYPRVVVLHLSVLLVLVLVLREGGASRVLFGPVDAGVPLTAVLVLLGVKTVVDLLATGWVLRGSKP